jgi:methanogenic corrinoid protein MtbC1
MPSSPPNPTPPQNPTNTRNLPRQGDQTEHEFLSALLSTSASTIAERAADDFADRFPTIFARYEPLARDKWLASFAARIHDLAAAIHTGRTTFFADTLAWSRVAHEARSVPVDDLRAGLASIRRVIAHDLPEEDIAVAHTYLDAGARALDEPLTFPPSNIPTALTSSLRDAPNGPADTTRSTSITGLVAAQYLLAILEGDRRAACDCIKAALDSPDPARRITPHDVYLRVLTPAQRELGRLWHIGEVTVAEEHFGTATTQMVMAQTLPRFSFAMPNHKVLVAASVQGNSHDLGVRMIADLAEVAGFRVIYLGANVPCEDLAQAVKDFTPHVLALSASLHTQVPPIQQAIDAIRAIQPTSHTQPVCKIIVGGPPFTHAPALAQEIGADATATSAEHAVESIKLLAGLA